jgi:hypothetical protein
MEETVVLFKILVPPRNGAKITVGRAFPKGEA